MQALAGDGAEVDPFGTTDCLVMPAKAAQPDVGWRPQVSTETPIDELRSRLGFLIKREGWLDAEGITCPLKDNPEMSCSLCPFSKVDKPEREGHCQLCRIGVGQELITTLLIAKQAGSGQPG